MNELQTKKRKIHTYRQGKVKEKGKSEGLRKKSQKKKKNNTCRQLACQL